MHSLRVILKVFFILDPTVRCPVCKEKKAVQLHLLPQSKARATSRGQPPPSTRPGWGHTVPETQQRVKENIIEHWCNNTNTWTNLLKRRSVIEAITNTDITKTVLQKFPFLDHGTRVSNPKTKKPVVLSSLHYFMSCSLPIHLLSLLKPADLINST